MGFFSHLGDAFSGKIYKQNTLVGANIVKILEKSQKLPNSKFIKHWSFACILSTDVILNYLLFEKQKNKVNTFKNNIDKLTEDNVFEIIKLLAGHHLSVFKRNKNNIEFLKKFNMNEEILENNIFSFFSFTRDDEKTFRELDKEFDEDSGTKYFLRLYQKIFEKAYEMPDEKNFFSATLMAGIISINYTNTFIESLSDKLGV